jgi:hypothetical protein
VPQGHDATSAFKPCGTAQTVTRNMACSAASSKPSCQARGAVPHFHPCSYSLQCPIRAITVCIHALDALQCLLHVRVLTLCSAPFALAWSALTLLTLCSAPVRALKLCIHAHDALQCPTTPLTDASSAVYSRQSIQLLTMHLTALERRYSQVILNSNSQAVSALASQHLVKCQKIRLASY